MHEYTLGFLSFKTVSFKTCIFHNYISKDKEVMKKLGLLEDEKEEYEVEEFKELEDYSVKGIMARLKEESRYHKTEFIK